MIDFHELFKNEQGHMFAKGQVVFKEGDPGEHLCIVKSGSIELIINGKHFYTFAEGEMFGEMALINHEPRIATTIAATDSVVIMIDQRRFQFLVQQTPYFAIQVMKVMADRLRSMSKLV